MSGSRRRSVPADSLLNFSYPLPVFPSAENAPRRSSSRHSVPFNKKRHVRANFRFALAPGSVETDRTALLVDLVDEPIDWDRVILVNQVVEHPPYCPICLDVLIAPRITKCGHSACLKCILHYFSLSQRSNYSRCVLCAEPVYVGDLRCLTFDVLPSYQPRDSVTFVLCRRLSSSSEAMPVAPVDITCPFQFRSIIVGFDPRSIYQKEQNEIVQALMTADSEEIPYFRMALDCIDKLVDASYHDVSEAIRNLSLSTMGSDTAAASCDQKEYVFYQSLDGQLLFLNSLSFRCLLHEYGSFQNLPRFITAPILDVVRVRQTEGLRSKHRFIAHLPITTNYSLCDVELKNLVKKSTLSHFRDEIAHQAKIRAKHRAQQRRDEKRMEAISLEREKELLQRTRASAGPAPFANPLGPVSLDDFGPAIGNAKPSGVATTAGAWSAVAGKGLLASEVWEPLPSRPRPQISRAAIPENGATFSSIVGSQSAQASYLKPQKSVQLSSSKQMGARSNILFSNAGTRPHKN